MNDIFPWSHPNEDDDVIADAEYSPVNGYIEFELSWNFGKDNKFWEYV